MLVYLWLNYPAPKSTTASFHLAPLEVHQPLNSLSFSSHLKRHMEFLQAFSCLSLPLSPFSRHSDSGELFGAVVWPHFWIGAAAL